MVLKVKVKVSVKEEKSSQLRSLRFHAQFVFDSANVKNVSSPPLSPKKRNEQAAAGTALVKKLALSLLASWPPRSTACFPAERPTPRAAGPPHLFNVMDKRLRWQSPLR